MNKLLLLFIFLCAAFQLNAASITNTGTGNWNSTSTWTPAQIPGVNDDVTIIFNSTVTCTTAASCKSLTIAGSLTNTSGGPVAIGSSGVTIYTPASGWNQIIGSFNTSGTVSITNSDHNVTFTGDVSCGPITINGGNIRLYLQGNVVCSGSFSTSSSSVWLYLGYLVTGKTYTFTDITFSGPGSSEYLDCGSSVLNISGSLTLPYVVNFTAGTGTVNFNGSGAQTIPSSSSSQTGYAFNNLTLSNGGIKTLGKNITVNGTLSLQGTASLALGSSTLTYGGSSTLEYAGSSAQISTDAELPASGSPHSLTINNSNGVILHASRTIAGTLTLTSGTFTVGANTLTIQNPIAGTAANLSANITSSIAIGGSASGVNIPANVTALNNLTLNNSNGTQLQGPLSLAGTLTLTSGSITNSSNLTLGPSVTISRSGGSLDAAPAFGTSVNVNYLQNGSRITTGPELPTSTTVLNNLTINSTNGVLLNAPVTANGIFTLIFGSITTSATNLLTFTSTATVDVGGGVDDFSFVNGPMAYVNAAIGSISKNYPIGKGTVWRPLVLSLNQTAATSSTYTAEAFNSAPPVNNFPAGLDLVSKVRHYTISENGGGSAFTGGLLQIIWGPDDWATDNANVRIAQGPAAGGGTWVDLGGVGTGNQISGNITSTTAFTSLTNTIFTLANATGGANGLPVELSSFTSIVNGRNINLNWETKTEKNSNKFVIEKTKTDGNVTNFKWESVTSVKTSFNSNVPRQYSYIDKNLQSGKYQYRLKMMDNDGSFEYSKVIETEIALPKDFDLSQNYPNPFNPATKINYNLPNDSKVILEVYNLIGERVAQIVNEQQAAGYYVVNFGASSVKNVASGIYIYKLTAVDNTGKNFSSIKKMMLLK
jgi:hypothetical protein